MSKWHIRCGLVLTTILGHRVGLLPAGRTTANSSDGSTPACPPPARATAPCRRTSTATAGPIFSCRSTAIIPSCGSTGAACASRRRRRHAALPSGPRDQHAAAPCDFDGDGDWDLWIAGGSEKGTDLGWCQLWVQRAPLRFRDAAAGDPLTGNPTGRGRGALWADFDGDARPELLLLNYQSAVRLLAFDGHAWRDATTRLPTPPAVELWAPGRPAPGPDERARSAWTHAAVTTDLDGDRRTDLLALGRPGFCGLWWNDGARLRDLTAASGLKPALWPHVPVHAAAGDIDGDGDADLVLLHRPDPQIEPRREPVELWLNVSTPGAPRFIPADATAGLACGGDPVAALLADFDNDGALDLCVARREPADGLLNRIWRGDGAGHFADVDRPLGRRRSARRPPRVAAGRRSRPRRRPRSADRQRRRRRAAAARRLRALSQPEPGQARGDARSGRRRRCGAGARRDRGTRARRPPAGPPRRFRGHAARERHPAAALRRRRGSRPVHRRGALAVRPGRTGHPAPPRSSLPPAGGHRRRRGAAGNSGKGGAMSRRLLPTVVLLLGLLRDRRGVGRDPAGHPGRHRSLAAHPGGARRRRAGRRGRTGRRHLHRRRQPRSGLPGQGGQPALPRRRSRPLRARLRRRRLAHAAPRPAFPERRGPRHAGERPDDPARPGAGRSAAGRVGRRRALPRRLPALRRLCLHRLSRHNGRRGGVRGGRRAPLRALPLPRQHGHLRRRAVVVPEHARADRLRRRGQHGRQRRWSGLHHGGRTARGLPLHAQLRHDRRRARLRAGGGRWS